MSSYLRGTPFSSNASYTLAPWDGNLQYGFSDGMYSCSFGTAFKLGYIGIISEVKYFMAPRFYRPNFIGRTFFQGSMDGKTYTTIFVVG